MITGIGHTGYKVKDMEASLNYYCNILGFTKAFSLYKDGNEPWIEYVKIKDGQFIELFYNRKNDNPNGSYAHLCLEVDDINEIADRLRSAGVLLTEPKQAGDLNWQCWSADPDGNRIEFMQMNPESPQCKA